MPSKGSTYISGKRDLIIDMNFYNKFISEIGINIDYKTFRSIILSSNEEIANIIINDDLGFKLPNDLGYFVVTKYKSKKKPLDWKNTLLLNKKVPILNIHSFGYIYHIKWFKKGTLKKIRFKNCYKVEFCRKVKRSVSKNIKNGFIYHEWANSDFWSTKLTKKLFKN